MRLFIASVWNGDIGAVAGVHQKYVSSTGQDIELGTIAAAQKKHYTNVLDNFRSCYQTPSRIAGRAPITPSIEVRTLCSAVRPSRDVHRQPAVAAA